MPDGSWIDLEFTGLNQAGEGAPSGPGRPPLLQHVRGRRSHRCRERTRLGRRFAVRPQGGRRPGTRPERDLGSRPVPEPATHDHDPRRPSPAHLVHLRRPGPEGRDTAMKRKETHHADPNPYHRPPGLGPDARDRKSGQRPVRHRRRDPACPDDREPSDPDREPDPPDADDDPPTHRARGAARLHEGRRAGRGGRADRTVRGAGGRIHRPRRRRPRLGLRVQRRGRRAGRRGA